ncbi:MAG: glycoside hydrolase family 5 protein, partial [Thermoguttaceae bacterium]
SVDEFHAWIDKQCELLDKMLPECKKHGVWVVLDLHTPPGGRLPRKDGSAMRLFQEKKWQDAFVDVWEKLATRYKNEEMIWAYDLLNEPVEGAIADNIDSWRDLAIRTTRAIRKIDQKRPIIIEPAPWGSPEAIEWFAPFDPNEFKNIIYSVHMYIPHNFTHQGVYESPVGFNYPGIIDGKEWNKAALREALRAPIEYAKMFQVPVYIGEFSVIRWSPGESGEKYLKDVIEIFEEEGWDWAYHAFREWDGWSLEHGNNKDDHTPMSKPTPRLEVIKTYFDKNEK